jgi:hypothetical protein
VPGKIQALIQHAVAENKLIKEIRVREKLSMALRS